MLKRIPIVGQVLAAVVLATLLSSGAMAWLTLRGPPPREPPLQLEEITHLLDGAARLPSTRRHAPSVRLLPRFPAEPASLVRNLALERQLAVQLGAPATAVRVHTSEPVTPADGVLFGRFVIGRQLPGGSWRVIESGPDARFARWQRLTLLTIGLVFVLVALVGWVLAAGIARPIRRLAAAASEARQSDSWRLEIPAGPPEIRSAAIALRDLHQRTAEASAQRLAMLGAIAHDIGTPLARLAFRVEKLGENDRLAAQTDIDVMRRLLADSLTMARGWHHEAEPLDFADLVTHVVAREAASGREVRLARSRPAMVNGHPLSLERVVQNLIDNALRYGGEALVSLAAEGRQVVLSVRDRGPGFGDLDIAELLKPFVRGEGSRNPATGGSGLGLAIVAQVVERHGGELVLADHPEGGGLVKVRMPTLRASETVHDRARGAIASTAS